MNTNHLLAAKIVAVAVLVDVLTDFPDRYLPFVQALDHLPARDLRIALQVLFVVAAVALLLNRYVRTSCIVAGLALVVAVLSSQPFFRYNVMFAGCFLFCIGFATPTLRRWLPPAQVAVLYLGATLNKLRSAEWRSGQFMRAWAPYRISGQRYLFDSSLPANAIAKALSWTIIAVEAFLLIVFVMRAVTLALGTERRFTTFWRWAAFAGVAFHTGMYVVTGSMYGIFVFVILAAFLVLIDDPLPAPARAGLLVAAVALAVITRIDNATLILGARALSAVAVAGFAYRTLARADRRRGRLDATRNEYS